MKDWKGSFRRGWLRRFSGESFFEMASIEAESHVVENS